MEQELIQAAVSTFCTVPEVYQKIFQQMNVNFPDELVQAITEKPEEAVQMVKQNKELLNNIVTIYQQYGDQINKVVQQKTGMFAKGGKLGQLLNKYQKGGRVSEPIKGNWNDYHTIISAPGDTLRFKQYFSGPHEMQTYPNGNVRYTQTDRSGTYSSWAPGSKPNFWQRLIYGNRTASPETIENWEQLIYNHRNDSNVKDKTKLNETKVRTSPSISIFPGLTNRGLTKKDLTL